MLLLLGFLFFGSAIDAVTVVQRPLVRAATTVTSWVLWNKGAAQISAEELQTIIEQRDAMTMDAAEFALLEEENQQLRELLNFKERRQLRTVTASITGRSSAASAQTLLLDVGERDGVEEGYAVVVGEGMLIGKIQSVSAHSSSAVVLSDPDSAVAVSLLNENRTIGVVSGDSGNLLSMSFIPDEEEISANDVVVTSGLEEAIPSGLLLGIVNAVITDDQTPFQSAVIEPIADPRRFSNVLIVIPDAL